MRLHGTAVMPLDLYLEIMTGAVQQLEPNAELIQLAKVTATNMVLHNQVQQLIVTVHDGTVSIAASTSGPTPGITCQASVCCSSNVQSSTGTQPQLKGLKRVLLGIEVAAVTAAAQPAATAAATASGVGQGFCLPVPATTASAQLHAITNALQTAAVLPTAISGVANGIRSTASEAHIAATVTAHDSALLDAAVLHESSSAQVSQLRGVQLSSSHSLPGGRQAETSSAHMLYQVQWAVTMPCTLARSQHVLLSKPQLQPVAMCAALMAAAQQAAQRQQTEFNLHMTTAEPYQSMAVAMARTVAQEATAMSCTATISTALAEPEAAIFGSSNTAMSAVSEVNNGCIYQPSLLAASRQEGVDSPWRAARSCIVIGGTGSVGSLAGAWLAGKGVHEIVLVGRTGKLSEASAANAVNILAKQALEDEASMLTVVQCDAGTAEGASWLYRHSSPVDRYAPPASKQHSCKHTLPNSCLMQLLHVLSMYCQSWSCCCVDHDCDCHIAVGVFAPWQIVS